MTRQLQALNQVSRQTDLLVSDASEALSGCKSNPIFYCRPFRVFVLAPDAIHKPLLYSQPVLA
jgi:hypothetical protein